MKLLVATWMRVKILLMWLSSCCFFMLQISCSILWPNGKTTTRTTQASIIVFLLVFKSTTKNRVCLLNVIYRFFLHNTFYIYILQFCYLFIGLFVLIQEEHVLKKNTDYPSHQQFQGTLTLWWLSTPTGQIWYCIWPRGYSVVLLTTTTT